MNTYIVTFLSYDSITSIKTFVKSIYEPQLGVRWLKGQGVSISVFSTEMDIEELSDFFAMHDLAFVIAPYNKDCYWMNNEGHQAVMDSYFVETEINNVPLTNWDKINHLLEKKNYDDVNKQLINILFKKTGENEDR